MASNQIRLFDAKGIGPIDPTLLPKHIGELQNDPFRSLAAVTKNYGCWIDPRNVPFVEFLWGDFFREYLQDKVLLYQVVHSNSKRWCAVRPYSPICIFDEEQLLLKLLPDALKLCSIPAARDLPGFVERDTPIDIADFF